MATALVTGGTSGIGAAFTHALAARGDDLVLVARDTSRLDELAKALHDEYGVHVESLTADLAIRSEVQIVADRLQDAERPIDLLVNNAGFGLHTELTEDPDTQERALDVMCKAILILATAAARAMRSRRHGAIINVSSVAGFLHMGGYSAIKAWETSFSESLAIELAGTGVHVTALCPGFVRTEFHQRADIDTRRIPRFGWIGMEHVITTALRDSQRGRVVSIPTKRYRLAVAFLRHAPRTIVRRISVAIRFVRHSSGG